MTEMIDANQAKEILGCDDATLQSHINAGEIQAQRVNGRLMVSREDVERVHAEGDATIVLTGDSDNLSIDLGQVVDDTSETIVQPKAAKPPAKQAESSSITFGDELEVVSFDESSTSQVSLDHTAATTKPSELSFTDSNTAVSATAVEETQVGGTTSPIEFTTSQVENAGEAPLATDAGRRSVRSSRARVEVVTVHWLWPILLGLALFLGLTLIAPYYVMATWPHGPDELDAKGNVLRGVDDNLWTGLAGSVAGFSVEPNQRRFKQNHGGDATFLDIKTERDSQADWRFAKYQDKMTEPGERAGSFIIEKVSEDNTKATSKGGKREYQMIEQETQLGTGGSVKELKVTVWSSGAQ